MIEDHTNIPDLKGKTFEEIHRQRMAAKPDAWTMAWLKQKFDEIVKSYLGVCHLINNVVMMCQDNREKQEADRKRIETLETELKLAMVRIGELQVELGTANERLEKMSTWAKTVDKERKKSDTGK